MYKKGDKFIVEVDSVFTNDKGTRLYRIKGFNSLIFDECGLNKLDPYRPAKKKTNNDKFKEVFGMSFDEFVKDPGSLEWSDKEYKETNEYFISEDILRWLNRGNYR